ncbi:MAG: hypothetical protein OXE52_04200 [Chloroflexi bacterium]|nr:hypothetical protein [Chloroflexota bacterium]
MRQSSTHALLLTMLLLALIAPAALAHQPVCEFADLSARAPWRVPDATISYAYFGNVYPAGDVDYFRFQAEGEQSVLLSLSIPAISDQAVFSPVMAVYGPGIKSDRNAQLPGSLEIPDGHGVNMVPLGAEPVYWFEPFSRKYFWNWDDYYFKAPESSTYTVALWHPQNEIGRYAFVIGQREVFGGERECYETYSSYWTPLEAGVNPYRDRGFELAEDQAPVVDLQLFPLAGRGYNVRVQTLNFIFTPYNIDMDPVPGQGHAHLYVDGVKIARLYGEWYHLGALPADAEVLTVALYANDHSPFTVDGLPVSASLLLVDVMGGEA